MKTPQLQFPERCYEFRSGKRYKIPINRATHYLRPDKDSRMRSIACGYAVTVNQHWSELADQVTCWKCAQALGEAT